MHSKFTYDDTKADVYQQCLTAERLVPSLSGQIDVDAAVAIVIMCMADGAEQTMSCKPRDSAKNTFPRNPWFDAECKAAKKVNADFLSSCASYDEKEIAVMRFHAVTDRKKKEWVEQRAAQLCEMASRDPRGFWRALKIQKHDICREELAAQLEAF